MAIRSVLDELVPLVYDELHQIADGYFRRETDAHTLQPTSLIHEAYLRLAEQSHPDYTNRAHFYGVAARVMRQILVDHARARKALKRGGVEADIPLSDTLEFPERPVRDLPHGSSEGWRHCQCVACRFWERPKTPCKLHVDPREQ